MGPQANHLKNQFPKIDSSLFVGSTLSWTSWNIYLVPYGQILANPTQYAIKRLYLRNMVQH